MGKLDWSQPPYKYPTVLKVAYITEKRRLHPLKGRRAVNNCVEGLSYESDRERGMTTVPFITVIYLINNQQ